MIVSCRKSISYSIMGVRNMKPTLKITTDRRSWTSEFNAHLLYCLLPRWKKKRKWAKSTASNVVHHQEMRRASNELCNRFEARITILCAPFAFHCFKSQRHLGRIVFIYLSSYFLPSLLRIFLCPVIIIFSFRSIKIRTLAKHMPSVRFTFINSRFSGSMRNDFDLSYSSYRCKTGYWAFRCVMWWNKTLRIMWSVLQMLTVDIIYSNLPHLLCIWLL